MTKCIKCKQVFLKEVQKLSSTKKAPAGKACPGCKVQAPRQSLASFKAKKK